MGASPHTLFKFLLRRNRNVTSIDNSNTHLVIENWHSEAIRSQNLRKHDTVPHWHAVPVLIRSGAFPGVNLSIIQAIVFLLIVR